MQWIPIINTIVLQQSTHSSAAHRTLHPDMSMATWNQTTFKSIQFSAKKRYRIPTQRHWMNLRLKIWNLFGAKHISLRVLFGIVSAYVLLNQINHTIWMHCATRNKFYKFNFINSPSDFWIFEDAFQCINYQSNQDSLDFIDFLLGSVVLSIAKCEKQSKTLPFGKSSFNRV